MLLEKAPRLLSLTLLAYVVCCVASSPGVVPASAEQQQADLAQGDGEFVGSGVPGQGFRAYQIGYYDNDDPAAGNPFLDEELTVVETVFIFDYNMTERLAIWGKLSYDNVASASIERLGKFPEQTGASRDHYVGVDGGARYEISERRRVAGSFSGSGERDYASFGVGGAIEQDSEDHNSTIKLAGNAFFDFVDVILFNGADPDGLEERLTFTSTLSWYQIINPKLHSELGATFTLQSGLLETPYNAVVLESPFLPPNPNLDNEARGVEFTEELPEQRYRGALFGRLRQFLLGGTAVEIGGRLYQDSWGISSVALEPAMYQWIVPDTFSTRLRYRFYIQSAADDYSSFFDSEQTHRTQDADLGDFSSNGFGVKFTWNISELWQTSIVGDFVRRNDGLDELIGSIGVRRNF